MVMSVLPVNSSAPESTTVPRPKAKSRPEIIRTMLLLATPYVAMFVTQAGMPIRKPARMPRTSILEMGSFVLPAPAAE